MRAQNDVKPAEKAKNSQRLAGKSGRLKPRRPSIEVKGVTTTKRRRRKKGGWKSTKGLRWSQVQQVYDLRKAAAEAGTPLNYVVDVHAADEAIRADDAEGKRWLSNQTKNIQQAVRGRGKQPRQAMVPCVTIYEKRLGGDLHAHMLLHVAKGNDALQRLHDGDEINAHRAHSKTVDYLTKSRLPKGDKETEAKFPHKRQGGQDAIRGSRITFSSDAKRLLGADRKPAPTVAAEPAAAGSAPKPVLRVIVNNALAPGELQLSLLAEKPVTRLRDYAHGIMPRAVAYEVEARRKWLGLTQAALAAAIRVSRSQLTNALLGRFPLSEWVAARLRAFLLKGEKLAA